MSLNFNDWPLQLKINYGICLSKFKGIEITKNLFEEAFKC